MTDGVWSVPHGRANVGSIVNTESSCSVRGKNLTKEPRWGVLIAKSERRGLNLTRVCWLSIRNEDVVWMEQTSRKSLNG